MCRTFYLTYPQIQSTVSVELQRIDYKQSKFLLNVDELIQPIPSVELRKSKSRKEAAETYPIPSEMLLTRLSFSHFIELIRVEDDLQRLFYEVEAIKNNWSV